MSYEGEKEVLSDLTVRSELGFINVPKGMEPARFLSEGFDQRWQTTEGKELHLRINPEALKDVLLTVDGTTVFKCMEGRLFVLAKVNNVHIPFYQSSEGTGGKQAGAWHPYFGISYDGWIIKGGTDPNNPTGIREYHPEITRVQNILNENLKLLSGASYSGSGKIGTNRSGPLFEPQNVLFDLNEHLGYKFWARDERYGSDSLNGERQMLADHTGYNPENVGNPNVDASQKVHSRQWVEDVVAKIK